MLGNDGYPYQYSYNSSSDSHYWNSNRTTLLSSGYDSAYPSHGMRSCPDYWTLYDRNDAGSSYLVSCRGTSDYLVSGDQSQPFYNSFNKSRSNMERDWSSFNSSACDFCPSIHYKTHVPLSINDRKLNGERSLPSHFHSLTDSFSLMRNHFPSGYTRTTSRPYQSPCGPNSLPPIPVAIPTHPVGAHFQRSRFISPTQNHSHSVSPPTHLSPNEVDIEKLENGEEKRTCVMIRNLPNKYHRDDVVRLLFSIVNSHFSVTNFPIDYETGRNLGYCFVRFDSTKDLIKAHKRLVNCYWPGSDSVKTCRFFFAREQTVSPISLMESSSTNDSSSV